MFFEQPSSLLQQALFDAYYGDRTTRKRRADINYFVIDRRNKGDVASDRSLYSYFCTMITGVLDENTVEVTLGGNVPQTKSVELWCKRHKVKFSENGLTFEVTSQKTTKLIELAEAMRAIIRVRYTVPNYKYVCPRTARSLERLHDVLVEHWSGARRPAV